MVSVGTYWHTVRHLRPRQVCGRVWFRVARPVPSRRVAPPVRDRIAERWAAPVVRPASMVALDTFTFLNETRSLADTGWDDAAVEKLWRYNLHYFDDLSGPQSRERVELQRSLLSRWVRENPPASGTGWEPYPTSLRIVNWVKWAWRGNALPAECVHALAIQARWLSRRLEFHLLGNHLLSNAKGLVFAGLFFDGPEAHGWLDQGLAILAREVPAQILADGGHIERSPMYHAIALEDMLDIHNALAAMPSVIPPRRRSAAESVRTCVPLMRRWLAAMCHPDGEISFFNDAALGVAPARLALEAYAQRLGFGPGEAPDATLVELRESGYVRVTAPDAVALLDAAPLGPDYLPGHGHADTLSFELSLFGQRVFVNSGTSCYGRSAERLRQRGTSAHNTVVVDGADSSEVWAGFRVGRRAHPRRLQVAVGGGSDVTVQCAHDGYAWRPGRAEHERRWTFADRAILIDDVVSGGFCRAEARFHLHPSVEVEGSEGDASVRMLRVPRGNPVRFSVLQGRLRVESATWHPRFGSSVPTRCLCVELDARRARVQVEWSSPA